MNPNCLPSKLIITFLFIFPSTLVAQTYSNRVQWDAATCGQLVEDEFAERITEYLIANNVNPADDFGPFGLVFQTDFGWGTVASFGFQDNAFINFVSQNRRGLLIDERQLNATKGDVEQTFFLDPYANLGSVEGFCIRYGSAGFNIDIYEGPTVVESLHAPSSGATDLADFGWINVDGLNVTRVEIYSVPDDPAANTTTLISNFDFSIGVYCPPGASSFDQLTGVRDDVAALLSDATGSDAFFLARALATISRMLNASLWETETRLSQNGGNLFLNATAAVIFLQRTRNPQADAIIDDLMDVLGSIVNSEIAYATANGGASNLIEQAEYFTNLAESIDNPFAAALAYRLAWLNAYAATN